MENTYKKAYRPVLCITTILLFYIICIHPNRTEYMQVPLKGYDLEEAYYRQGPINHFFIGIGNSVIQKPKEYSEETINKMETELLPEEKTEKEKTDVIVIMSESLADFTDYSKMTFSTDPLENIHALSEEFISGQVVVPVIGKGTSITEFEFLTGLSSRFISEDSYPYVQYIKSDMNSFVREYRNNGYYCTAVHPNGETFYNRKQVFPDFGFHDFISSEDMENAPKKGYYISDDYLIDQIIQTYESNRNKQENQFIFGISMQNHLPYRYNEYESYDIEVEVEDLSETEEGAINAYIQGIYDADKAFLKLTKYFENSDRDVIIAIFGDHLPLIEGGYVAQINEGYCKEEENVETNLKMHLTPYLIWTNKEEQQTEENIITKQVSSNTLGMLIAKQAGIELNWYYRYIAEFMEEYPVITRNFLINKKGQICDVLPEIIENKYQILQYDLLFKKKHIEVIN